MSIDATAPPKALTAGMTIEWMQSAPAFPPSDDWTLEFACVGPSVLEDPIEGDYDTVSRRWAFELPSVVSAALAPGSYSWMVQATRGTGSTLERHPVAAGKILVLLDLFSAEAGATLSPWERNLSVLWAAFEGRLPKQLEGFQIYNRTVSLMPLKDLANLIAEFESKIALKKQRARGTFGRQYRVRFTGVRNERP